MTARRRGLAISVGDPVRSADGLSLDWTVTSEAAGVGTEVLYSLLRWDDIVRERFPRSNLTRLLAVPRLWWRLWRCGYVKAFRREARQFSTVILTVHLIYAAFVILSLALAAASVRFAPDVGPAWIGYAAIPLIAYAILGLVTRLTRNKPLYVTHLVDDTAFTHAHAASRDGAMRLRLDAWAERIRTAQAEAAEIVVIGHSSSSFLALEALERVLAADPGFGRHGTPVTLVTLGSVIPWITLDPLAAQTRAALKRIAEADAIGWLDLRATWDWLSIHLRNPLAASGLPVLRPDRPAVRHVRIQDLIEPETVARRRWNLFRMHFQLLMSSRDPKAFDYIAFVASPRPIRESPFVVASSPVVAARALAEG